MTQIINGYAQPDIVAKKGTEKVAVFVETPSSLKKNATALKRTWLWIGEHEPNTRIDLVQTVSRKK